MIIGLTVSLLIVQVFCLIIPIINKQQEQNRTQIKYSLWDKALILLTIISLGLSITIYLQTKDQEEIKEELEAKFKQDLKKGLAERDSIHNLQDSSLTTLYINKLDSSYTKSIKASNQALAKYNLILIDSMQKVATKINVKAINIPQLGISPSGISNTPSIYLNKSDTPVTLRIKHSSQNNISYNINLRYYLLQCSEATDKKMLYYSLLDSGYLFYNRQSLATNIFATSEIPIKPQFENLSCTLILLVGEFSSDFENKNILPYSESFIYDLKNNKMIGSLDSDFTKAAIANLKKRFNRDKL